MASKKEINGSKKFAKAAAFGAVTLALYVLLFANEQWVLSISASGKWAFVIPVAIAFVFSYLHGNFTSEFWDILGVKARKVGGKA